MATHYLWNLSVNREPRVITLNHTDISGGAARAAYRIHHCLRSQGIDSRMWVNKALAGDWTVNGPVGKFEKAVKILRTQVGGQIRHMLKTDNPVLHSPALLPSRWPKRINESNADIVHLHWVGSEMLSIADIGRITKPVVWTLHDMWAFCGAEHYTEDFRWRDGYRRDNRPAYESGFDLSRWTWQRKRKHWQCPMHIVALCDWMRKCVKESLLFRDWPCHVIPNPLDTDRWSPLDQRLARDLLHLPQDVPFLLFGAIGGDRDPRKGFDLLAGALSCLRSEAVAKRLELMVFGQLETEKPPEIGFPVHYTGHLHDDLSLRILYCAADALVLPSRQDNLPNTGVEAQACGTPVVAFNTCGLPDIVDHQTTGYLARPFEAEDLAAGIIWILQSDRTKLREQSRKRAVERYACKTVAEQYRRVYAEALESAG